MIGPLQEVPGSSLPPRPSSVTIHCPEQLSYNLVTRIPTGAPLPARMGYFIKVRDGQVAVLAREGLVLDVLSPGTHQLSPSSIPILSAVLAPDRSAAAPFEVHVYFVSVGEFAGIKWGTPNGILAALPSQGTVILQAWGSYTLYVSDPSTLVAHSMPFGVEMAKELHSHLRYRLVTVLAQVVSQLASRPDTTLADLLSSADSIATYAKARLQGEFREFGLDLKNIYIHNLSVHDASLEQLWLREQEQIRLQPSSNEAEETAQDLRRSSRLLSRYRAATAALLALIGLVSFAAQPSIAPWPWLSAHPHSLGLRLSTLAAFLGACWALWDQDKKRRTIALVSVVLASIFVILQII